MGNSQYRPMQRSSPGLNPTQRILAHSYPRSSYQPMKRSATVSGSDRLQSSSTAEATGGGGAFAIRKPVHTDAVTCLAAVRSGMVITGGRDASLAMVNMDTGECIRRWTGHSKEVTKVAYRNLGGKHVLLSASRDSTVRLWKFNSADAAATYAEHEFAVTAVDTVSETQFCSGARDTSLKLWDINSSKSLVTQKRTRNVVTHICKAKSENFLAQSGEDKEVKLWDSRDLSLIHQFPKKQQIQTHCDVLPDGLYCISASNGFNGTGCEISVWDVRQRKLLHELKGHEETVHAAVYMPQQVTWKRLIISVSADHSVRLWNIDDGWNLWSEYVPSGGDLLAAVGFNDGNIVVAGMNACLVHLRLLGRAGRPLLNSVSMQEHMMSALLAYFEDVGRPLRRGHGRRAPMFSPQIWNVYERTLAGVHRTNNHAEAAHRRMQSELGMDHPIIWKFIDAIRKVQKGRDVFYSSLLRGDAPSVKLKKYVDADERILTVCRDYANRTTDDYLSGMAHNFEMNS